MRDTTGTMSVKSLVLGFLIQTTLNLAKKEKSTDYSGLLATERMMSGGNPT